MIHHISIAVQNPLHVAQVIAEVWRGQAFPFFPCPGSYMALPMDEHGTVIEVLPLQTQLVPGTDDEQSQFVQVNDSRGITATHAAISVPISQEEIEAIGKREGWRVLRCNRDGFFDVIEFWLENTVMLELLTPEMTAEYLAVIHPENLKRIFTANPILASV
ncbi:hypothetical protein H6G41_17810 [Tolypothrix sp. FACHB-123]|uniref:hypothetical protein n=1 Tax=Tolypothrix sp. FACHB-123 TaxID=2692868 RepID=UPI0016897971|nr:hypothetical protein [Tolypothrix sp. FACHB-123]MBD2356459.1 hypothetical protein [Tolypothrix sp. FACHB-123]